MARPRPTASHCAARTWPSASAACPAIKIESQRGGNGYIRILKISYDMPEDRARHIDRIVGESISEADAHRLLTSLQTRGMVSVRERLLIEISLRHIAELCDTTFDVSPYKKGVMQADLLKRMLCGLDLV